VRNKRHSPVKQRVRLYLAEHDMTQDQLAAHVGITAGHLSHVLSRKHTPSLRVAVALENITGVSVREFLPSRAR
jgi:transcriptional regulator with XRE-family HTH domain